MMNEDLILRLPEINVEKRELFLRQDHRKEVLIVDDEIDFRLDLAELLVAQGYRVSTASNGEAAMEYLLSAENLPDLITVDLKMPIKNGWEFKEELERMNLLKRIPLIMISGLKPLNSRLPKGIKATLAKPLDKLEFLEIVEKALKP